MHFIVTGGAGFIGSHLTEQLLSDGHFVTVVDNLITGSLQNLSDHPRLKILFKNVLACQPEDFVRPIDGIAHLAATPSVTESWANPLDAHHNNLSTTLAAIQLCQTLEIPKLVLASSAAVYGGQAQLPISENQTPDPLSPYGLHKLVSEQYAALFAQEVGFSFVGLRLFNVFGPRQMPGSPYSGVISIFVEAMQQGLPITLYGDGSQTRDFVYVKDVAIAFTKALTTPLASGSSLICNIGSGQSISLKYLLMSLQHCFPNWEREVNFAPSRTGDILHSQANITKAATCLNFTPQYSFQSSIQLWLESQHHSTQTATLSETSHNVTWAKC